MTSERIVKLTDEYQHIIFWIGCLLFTLSASELYPDLFRWNVSFWLGWGACEIYRWHAGRTALFKARP